MFRSRLPRRGSKHPLTQVSVVATVAALAVAGIGAVPASSAGSSACPAPATAKAGEPVHGLTVSKGTKPDKVTGTVLGVLQDGIAPDMDMILVRLESPEIQRVGGIWEGMSGSPVYNAAGGLIGAVSYGLAVGPSPVAGVTPAADMEQLLSSSPAKASPRFRTHVALSAPLRRKLVSSGATTTAGAAGGLSQLKLPFSVTGANNARRMEQIGNLFKLDNMRMVPSGGSPRAVNSPADIFPGSNLAASMSYGDVTAAGTGTTTAVCGAEVLAFGHPFNFTGPASMTMHAADAIYVQEDPTLSPFKVSNIGGPVGTISGDHLAGIVGTTGPTPKTWTVTSKVTVGTRHRTGRTHISVQDFFSDIATVHLLVDEDRLFDGIGKGSGLVTWNISGLREDGKTPFHVIRKDVYADPFDLTFATAIELNDVLNTLQFNGIEDITLTGAATTSDLNRDFAHYQLSKIQRYASGAWHNINLDRTMRVKVGTNLRLRAVLSSKSLGTKIVRVDTPVPTNARRSSASSRSSAATADPAETSSSSRTGPAPAPMPVQEHTPRPQGPTVRGPRPAERLRRAWRATPA